MYSTVGLEISDVSNLNTANIPAASPLRSSVAVLGESNRALAPTVSIANRTIAIKTDMTVCINMRGIQVHYLYFITRLTVGLSVLCFGSSVFLCFCCIGIIVFEHKQMHSISACINLVLKQALTHCLICVRLRVDACAFECIPGRRR